MQMGVAGGAALLMAANPAMALAADRTKDGATPMGENDGRHDFDFFAEGVWKVSHRRLKTFLAGATEWDSFEGTVTTRTMLNNLVTIDENDIRAAGGAYRGSTLRVFDPATQIWSIYWIDGRFGILDPAMRGKWENGRCVLTGDDTYKGKPIKLRQEYSRLPGQNPHWQQAMSIDDGKTWETNWHMDYTRA